MNGENLDKCVKFVLPAGFNLNYGGYVEGHAKAQEDAWLQVESYFKEKLPKPEQKRSQPSKL